MAPDPHGLGSGLHSSDAYEEVKLKNGALRSAAGDLSN